MLPTTRNWLDGLRDFVAEQRLRRPLCGAASTPERAAERMILAAQLATTLAGWERLVEDRQASGSVPSGIDPDPAVVFTTSPVGIAVADEQVVVRSLVGGSLAAQAVAVTELEYRLWCIRQPDDDHRLHVNLWNWIKTRVPPQRHAEFARHPLRDGEAYWLHRAGIAGVGAADRRDCHLWKWNGRHASLLEAFVTERGVSELT